jgi:protein-tyrosine kinase
VSLIENALEKLRRNSVPSGRATGPASSHERGPTAGPGAAALAAPEPPIKAFTIDWTGVRAAGYLPEESESRRFADYYRQIKRPLIEKAFAADSLADARLILVSSALPGDGKSFTAVNLALSMARERDHSVLLIDADLPRARISQVFGASDEPGLADALEQESVDVESLILRTDIRGLEFLPAGKAVVNATELLASERMTEVAMQIAARDPRRLVLFDSSPLLGSTEVRALMRIPGQIVLVVRACETPRQAVLDAVAHLDIGKLRGLVLNQAPTARGSGYYYGYSGYGAIGEEKTGRD